MSERVSGRGVGVEDNLSGPVWVMEWTSVIVIMLRIPKKKKEKKKKKTAKQNKGKQRGRAARQKTKYKVSCFIILIFLQLKQTNDSPFRLLSSFPVKS